MSKLPINELSTPELANVDDFVIVVAGGGSGSIVSTFIPCIHRKVTMQIDKYKPNKWQELINSAEKDLQSNNKVSL
jgi:hypothetical protein